MWLCTSDQVNEIVRTFTTDYEETMCWLQKLVQKNRRLESEQIMDKSALCL